MLSQIFTLALLAATTVCSPVAQGSTEPATTVSVVPTSTSTTSTRTRPSSTAQPRVCVLTEGANPVIIDPFQRPDCVCRCYKSACESLNVGGSYSDYVECINKYFGPNKVNFGTDMIAYYGACVGSTRCIG